MDERTGDCELCEAARMTTWYYEDAICWIAECDSCAVPMVVWKRHGIDPSDADRAHMLEALQRIAAEHGASRSWIDELRRSIPDHYHAHARRAWGT